MIDPSDIAKVKREKRLRRQILRLVDAAKVAQELNGQTILDVLEDSTDGIREPDEIVRLARDLVNLGLLTERDSRTRKFERPGLQWMFYSITGKGTRLLSQLENVEPLVDDERI